MQKQFKRILKTLAIAPYFLGCAFVSTSLSGVIELVSNDYKTADQIDSDALKFNADISNCTTNGDVCTRLKHNNGRPIYVYVSDEYSDKEIEYIQYSLDYFENVFDTIDTRYNFKIVSRSEFMLAFLSGQTTIEYLKSDLNQFVEGTNSGANKILTPNLVNRSVIQLSKDFNLTDDFKKYVLFHELCHSFGLGDVYSELVGINQTSIYQGDTVLNISELAIRMCELFPNDYKFLQALYNQNHLTRKGTLAEEELNILQNISNFETAFFSKATTIIEAQLFPNADIGFINNEITNNEYVFNEIMSTSNGSAEYSNHIYFQNDNYIWKIFKDDILVYETSGQYINSGNVIVLPNMHFDLGMQPNSHTLNSPEVRMVMLVRHDDKISLVLMDTLDIQSVSPELKTSGIINSHPEVTAVHQEVIKINDEFSFILPPANEKLYHYKVSKEKENEQEI